MENIIKENEVSNNEVKNIKSINCLFSEALFLFKKRIWGFYGVVFLSGAIIFGVVTLSSIIFSEVIEPKIIIMITLTLFVLTGIVSLIGLLTALYYFSNEKSGVINSFKETKGLIGHFAWLSVIMSLLIIGVLGVFMIPTYFLGEMLGGGMGAAILFIGGFLSFLFSFSLLISFIFSSFILVNEKEKGINNILRSHAYVKKHRSAIFLRLLVPVILIFITQVGSNILFGENHLLTFLVTMTIFPLFAFYMYRLYINAKELAGEIIYEEKTRKQVKILCGLGIVTIILGVGIILKEIISYALLHF